MFPVTRSGNGPLLFWLLLLLLTPAAVNADSEELEIDADHWEVDGREGISIYEGNVVIRHKELLIQADRAVFTEREPGVFEKAEMTGSPVTLVITPEDGPRTEGEAEFMRYRFEDEVLLMEGTARLKRPRQTLSAESIEYTIPGERIRAQRGEDDEGRVRTRFERGEDSEQQGGGA